MPASPHGRYITDSGKLWRVLCSGITYFIRRGSCQFCPLNNDGLEQQNAGRAHAGHCHASSYSYLGVYMNGDGLAG